LAVLDSQHRAPLAPGEYRKLMAATVHCSLITAH
jgi:hypothetical protein